MDSDKLSVEEMVEYYKPDVEELAVYIPWLETHKGGESSSVFTGEGVEKNSITFPVYDTTLMNFVKAAQASSLMNRNYVYVYSRNRIRTEADEHRFIRNATIKEMGDLWGILSKYILKGMTKAALWSEGVRNGVFLELLLKMKEILAYWDRQRSEA
ncbi:MAG: hypothetical protein HFI91_12805 [Lachnospiraceae bacterium]|jgi:hypothetical protein|nr:hypothetical protein [Lachnospiraceae bacterium]